MQLSSTLFSGQSQRMWPPHRQGSHYGGFRCLSSLCCLHTYCVQATGPRTHLCLFQNQHRLSKFSTALPSRVCFQGRVFLSVWENLPRRTGSWSQLFRFDLDVAQAASPSLPSVAASANGLADFPLQSQIACNSAGQVASQVRGHLFSGETALR